MSAFTVIQYILWLSEENPFSHNNVVRKGKSILIAFADNYG